MNQRLGHRAVTEWLAVFQGEHRFGQPRYVKIKFVNTMIVYLSRWQVMKNITLGADETRIEAARARALRNMRPGTGSSGTGSLRAHARGVGYGRTLPWLPN